VKSDDELKKTFEIREKENNIVHFSVVSECSEKQECERRCEIVMEEFKSIFDQDPQRKVGILLDLSGLRDVKFPPTPQARQKYVDLASHKQIGKIAILGSSPFHVSIAKSVFILAEKDNISAFNSEEEALKWLNTN
jgi:hypothetical protein